MAEPRPPVDPPPPAPPPAPPAGATLAAHAADPSRPSARRDAWAGLLQGSPSWLTSLALHLTVVLLLAVWTLPPLTAVQTPELLSEPVADVAALDDFEEINLEKLAPRVEPLEFQVQPKVDQLAEEVSVSTFEDMAAAPSFTDLSDLGLTPALPAADEATASTGQGAYARGRMSLAAIAKAGGSAESERAIADALEWLAEHQNPDGTWTLVHTAGPCRGRCDHPARGEPGDKLRAGTGLALLPFLGAGQTHKTGRYKRVVQRGLDALTALGRPEDLGVSWRDPAGAGAYSHGIAAIALCEAYGMTGDSGVGAFSQAAIDHIVASQGADGGWRYFPRDPIGDTSVVGWQVMALKSASLAKLNVPPAVAVGATSFLNSVAREGGSEYTYLPSDPKGTPTRSSIGLLCRMYLGWQRDNEALQQGIEKVAAEGPSESNFYYNYYASQVLFQYTSGKGPLWREWNTRLRDQLIDQQATEGHAKGSWFEEGEHNNSGGRLYMTSLAAMTLEVYYRYMPIYQAEAVETGFPE